MPLLTSAVSSKRTWRSGCFVMIALALPVGSTGVARAQALILERSIPGTEFRPVATFEDYDGDGLEDLIVPVVETVFKSSALSIISAADGRTLRTIEGEPSVDPPFGLELSTFSDVDGDGLREILVGDPLLGKDRQGAAYAVRGGGPGGLIVDEANLLYRIPGPGPDGGFGNATAATETYGLVAWSDEGRVLVIDLDTGTPLARLSGRTNGGFGFSILPIGDVNGDGVEDWLTSDPNANITVAARGEIYILDGTIRTSGDEWVPIDDLPDGQLIAVLTDERLGLGSSRERPYANLGDPVPDDAVHERLIVCGSPGLEANGFMVHRFTVTPAGEVETDLVAALRLFEDGLAAQVENVGDVDGDGVDDVALLDLPRRGAARLRIVSGGGLLDDFQEDEDTLQEIGLSTEDERFRAIRAIGDYDSDGRLELVIVVRDERNSESRYQIWENLRRGPGLQVPGDCNQDGVLDVSDALCILGVLFLGDPERFPCGEGTALDSGNLDMFDWEPNGIVTISDALALLVFAFMGGPAAPLAVAGDETTGCIPIASCPESEACP